VTVRVPALWREQGREVISAEENQLANKMRTFFAGALRCRASQLFRTPFPHRRSFQSYVAISTLRIGPTVGRVGIVPDLLAQPCSSL